MSGPTSERAEDGTRDTGRATAESPTGDLADGTATAAPSLPVTSGRWAVVLAVALVAVGLGVATQSRLLLVSAVVPLAFAVYGRLSTAPAPELSARRSFDSGSPTVGERVQVTVTVRNRGAGLRDCRVVDTVPASLAVVSGTPATAVRLRPGEEASFSYTVRARRGDREFGPLRAVGVDASGAAATGTELSAESRLRCRASGVAEVGDAPSTSGGSAATDSRGGGVEFHAVREYHPSDPLNRVDWRRFARTGELSTVEFREDRAATVAVVVDAAAATFRRPGPDAPAAVEYALYAAEGAFEALLERDARVALAFYPDAPAALDAGSGVDHRTLGRRALDAYGPGATTDPGEVPVALGDAGRPERRRRGATASERDQSRMAEQPTGQPAADGGRSTQAASQHGPDEAAGTDSVTALRAGLPSGARVLFCSPLLDDGAVDLVRELRADEHDVRVLAPDPETETAAARLAGFERSERVARLRGAGVAVVNWDDGPLREALARALRGW